MPSLRRPLRLGLLLHRNKVWISEPFGILFVALLLAGLVSMTAVIIARASQVHNLQAAIKSLKAAAVESQHELQELAQKNRVAIALASFAKDKIPGELYLPLIDLVYASSRQFGYDPLLVFAVIRVESYFDPRALGRFQSGEYSGAVGLMQLKFETAREVAASLGVVLNDRQDLFRPEINIPLGIAYLTREIAHFRSFKLGVLAYNQGPGAIRQALTDKTPLSIGYYERVLQAYYALRATVDDE